MKIVYNCMNITFQDQYFDWLIKVKLSLLTIFMSPHHGGLGGGWAYCF